MGKIRNSHIRPDSPHRPKERQVSRSRSRTPRNRSTNRRESCSTKMEFHAHKTPVPLQNNVIAVFGLMDNQKSSDLREMFNPFGKIEIASVVNNPRTGRSRGYGFVHFSRPEEAACAKKYWDGVILGEKRIQVSYSYAQQAHRRTPGVYCKRFSHKLVDYRPSFRRSPSREKSS